MSVQIEQGWHEVLKDEFEKPYFQSLIGFVKTEYSQFTCYPAGKNIFAAFDACPWDKVKVIIIGQDPYHGPGQANGLCFSVHHGITHPPSLVNIFKEIETDLNIPYPKTGDLKSWANQGVLLLNATLSVRAHQAGSHQNKGWETFTDKVIEKISTEKSNLVFLLWGSYAKNKGRYIDKAKHKVLTSGHPSPLSANRGYWFGNRHFSQANTYLASNGIKTIDWSL